MRTTKPRKLRSVTSRRMSSLLTLCACDSPPAWRAPAALRGTRATKSSTPSTSAENDAAHQMLSGLVDQTSPPMAEAKEPPSAPKSRAWPYSNSLARLARSL